MLKNINLNKEFRNGSKFVSLSNALTNYLNEEQESEHNYRLPKTSTPVSYDLHLTSNIHSGSLAVEGDVTLKIRVVERTDRLTLHSRDLLIQDLNLFQADGIEAVKILRHSLYAPTDMLTIYLLENAEAETEFILEVKYVFAMNTLPSQTGFYRTSYQTSDGETRLAFNCIP